MQIYVTFCRSGKRS